MSSRGRLLAANGSMTTQNVNIEGNIYHSSGIFGVLTHSWWVLIRYHLFIKIKNCPQDIATSTKCDCCPSVENCPQDIATATKCDCCPSVGNRHNPDRDKQVESPSRPQKQKVAKMPARRDSPPQGLSTRKCYWLRDRVSLNKI